MADTPMSEADGLVLVLKADESDKLDFDSPLVEPGLAKLEIQSPAATDEPSQTTLPATTEGKDAEDAEDKENIAPAATVPPPLPARPVPVLARQESALEEGLKFGMQQDSAEVLLNIVAQLEMAFELPPREDGSAQTNLITRSVDVRNWPRHLLTMLQPVLAQVYPADPAGEIGRDDRAPVRSGRCLQPSHRRRRRRRQGSVRLPRGAVPPRRRGRRVGQAVNLDLDRSWLPADRLHPNGRESQAALSGLC